MANDRIVDANYSPTETDRSTSPSISPSASPSSRYYDDSSEIDELDYRSRQLTHLLKNNVNKSAKRTNVLDVVKRRAWLLTDQVEKLQKQTKKAKNAIASQSLRRRLVIFCSFMASIVLIGLGVNHVASTDEE